MANSEPRLGVLHFLESKDCIGILAIGSINEKGQ